MFKIKNKHTGEVIETPYLAEVEEYLNSGDYEMSKPVYTKEMHERGELPPVGSFVELSNFTRCEVLINKLDSDKCILILAGGEYMPVKLDRIKPTPTIEGELTMLFKEQSGMLACDLARYVLSKYNITPK